jgi:hypothetical protein
MTSLDMAAPSSAGGLTTFIIEWRQNT